ncbi:unnamed protein product [Microthlaspi erraticum]|uniref:Uncharacterized protein n=1 Tax=Microthlaspi erraticum TaxID=1685480 RepID=A0A6D2IYG4_9BRAS|nr:unnamed protein product [Microthlaspi erraticum]
MVMGTCLSTKRIRRSPLQEEEEDGDRSEEKKKKKKNRKRRGDKRESTMNLHLIHMPYRKRKPPIEIEEIRNLLRWQWRKHIWNWNYRRRILKLEGEAAC